MTSSPTRRLMEHSVVRYSPIDEIPSHTDEIHTTIPTEEIHAILITSQATSEGTQTDTDLDTSSKHCCYRYRLALIMTTLLLTVAIILSMILISTHTVTSTPPSITTCDIFCYGDILHAIETSGILYDSKSFVDMPLLRSPDDVMNDFRSLSDTNTTSILIAFLNRNFAQPGSDLVPWTPADFKNEPKFLKEIHDSHYRKWASELNTLWLSLGKQISTDVYQHPERHTLLPALSPYMIVPGGRFREYYYWDSYWIVRGLITCDMLTTAKIIVENLLFFVRTYGFVPNGSRIYYLNRSQPPLLTLTVQAYFNATQDHDLLRDALPVLDKEYEYWMKIGAHAVSITNKTTGNSYLLNRYYTNMNYPRPESYAEDMATALSLPWPFNPEGTKKREEMFAQLAASAETGWDFSSRFFQDRKNLSSANTMDVIPVDLNAILYINERTLGDWHKSFNNHKKSQYYHHAAEQRLDAIEALLWDGHNAVWRDYNWVDQEHQDIAVASNFIPLWAKCYRLSTVNESRVLSSFLSSGLIQPGGIVTTLSNIGQQWDWPNAWAPIQHMITEGLATLSGDAAIPGRQQAFHLASRWLASNWMAYNMTGVMFEKYVATMMGQPGNGGEYILQKGFGWTNGVALILLEQYGDILNLTHTLTTSQSPMMSHIYNVYQYTQEHQDYHPPQHTLKHPHQHQHQHEPHDFITMSAIDHHNLRLNNLLSPHLHTGTFALSHQHDDIPSYHIMMQTSSRIHKRIKKQRAHALQPETNIIQPSIPVVTFPHTQAHAEFVERMQQKQQQHMEIS